MTCCESIDEILEKHENHISDMLAIFEEEGDYDYFYIIGGNTSMALCGWVYYYTDDVHDEDIVFSIDKSHWVELP